MHTIKETDKFTAVLYKHLGAKVDPKAEEPNGKLLVVYYCEFDNFEHYSDIKEKSKLEKNTVDLQQLKLTHDRVEKQRREISNEYYDAKKLIEAKKLKEKKTNGSK